MHNEMQWPSVMRVFLKLNWDYQLDLELGISELTVTIAETCHISQGLLVIPQCYVLHVLKVGHPLCSCLSQPTSQTYWKSVGQKWGQHPRNFKNTKRMSFFNRRHTELNLSHILSWTEYSMGNRLKWGVWEACTVQKPNWQTYWISTMTVCPKPAIPRKASLNYKRKMNWS